MGEDKRGARRVAFPCDVECSYGFGANTLNLRLSDLSVTGAFIDSMTELPPGTKVTLKLHLPSGPLPMKAEVVHSMPHFGMGVRFLDMTEEQKGAIEAVVRSGS